MEGQVRSDCQQLQWLTSSTQEEAFSGVNASEARLINDAKARKKETPQEVVTKKMQELEKERMYNQLNGFEASSIEKTKATSSLRTINPGQTFGIIPQGNKIQSFTSVAENQLIRNSSEPREFTKMHLDI